MVGSAGCEQYAVNKHISFKRRYPTRTVMTDESQT